MLNSYIFCYSLDKLHEIRLFGFLAWPLCYGLFWTTLLPSSVRKHHEIKLWLHRNLKKMQKKFRKFASFLLIVNLQPPLFILLEWANYGLIESTSYLNCFCNKSTFSLGTFIFSQKRKKREALIARRNKSDVKTSKFHAIVLWIIIQSTDKRFLKIPQDPI